MADRLWIRYATNDDTGARPAQGVTWLSPSLNPSTQPKVDVATTIVVVVDAAQPVSNVSLQVWAARFGAVPLTYAASTGGNGGRVRTGLASTPSGTRHIIEQAIAWTPLDGDASTAEYHMCLQANCWIPGVEGAQQGVGGAMPAIDIVNNRHHAQHNITVLARNSPIELDVDYGNNREQGEHVTLEAVVVDDLLLGPGEIGRLHAFHGHGPGPKQGGDKDKDRLPWKTGKGRPRSLELHGQGKSAKKLKLDLEAGEHGAVRLSADFEDDDEGLYAIDFIQRDGNGAVMGGARVLTVPELVV